MLFQLIGITIVLGSITGFAYFSKRAFFNTFGGQLVHGALSISCFALVAIAFWRFGWGIGLFDFFLVIISANLGLTL